MSPAIGETVDERFWELAGANLTIPVAGGGIKWDRPGRRFN